MRPSVVLGALDTGLLLPPLRLPQALPTAAAQGLQRIRCKHQTSLTAGTVFENTKLGLSKWCLAMYLLTRSKNGISAMDLKRQQEVNYNSAWMIKHKFRGGGARAGGELAAARHRGTR